MIQARSCIKRARANDGPGQSPPATVPVAVMKEERKEDLVWVPAGLSFRHYTEKGDGNRDSQYMMKQGRTMIQLVGKQPTESTFLL